jgi:hypothetical protein
LEKKTQNVVLAEVVSSAGNKFVYNFNITAPALGDYTYKLFTISHPIDLYPLQLLLDRGVAKDIGITRKGFEAQFFCNINDEAEFLKVLDQILKADRTKQIIRNLLAQSSG